jgi:hypothetical protein
MGKRVSQYTSGSGGGGGTGTLSQVLTAGNNGTGQSIIGINSITASILRSLSSTNLTILADSGGKIIANDNGNIAANAVGFDLSGMGGAIRLKTGAVGGVSVGWGTIGDRGFYDGTTQINVSVGGALVGAFGASGLKTGQVSDLSGTLDIFSTVFNDVVGRFTTVSGAPVIILGDINNTSNNTFLSIDNNTGAMTASTSAFLVSNVTEIQAGVGLAIQGTAGALRLMQNIADTAYNVFPASTTSHAHLNLIAGAIPTTPNNGDLWWDGTNLFFQVGGVTKTFTLI